jgi:hypothetical protein
MRAYSRAFRDTQEDINFIEERLSSVDKKNILKDLMISVLKYQRCIKKADHVKHVLSDDKNISIVCNGKKINFSNLYDDFDFSKPGRPPGTSKLQGKHQKYYQKNGYIVKYGLSPILMAENDIRIAKRDIVKKAFYLTNIAEDELIIIPILNRYIDIVVSIVEKTKKRYQRH